uniref:Putative secreted protein n=1 Tax=Anopheles darlingi TaxID=43151 RepID=A0A2M4D8Y7_ANODA
MIVVVVVVVVMEPISSISATPLATAAAAAPFKRCIPPPADPLLLATARGVVGLPCALPGRFCDGLSHSSLKESLKLSLNGGGAGLMSFKLSCSPSDELLVLRLSDWLR